ncbi:MAG: hypothetical protein WCA23_34390 [Stellaceae bacterium]
MARGRRRRAPIHSSIKEALGYDATDDDAVVRSDLEERKRRVCKPCWELKYCPYGPLVEQSPTLPTLRADAAEHNAYLRGALETGLTGSIEVLTPEKRAQYEEWLADEELLLRQAVYEVRDKQNIAELEKLDEDEEKLQRFAGPLPPIHIYRAAFDEPTGNTPVEQDFSPEIWDQIQQSILRRKELYAKALQPPELTNEDRWTRFGGCCSRSGLATSTLRSIRRRSPTSFLSVNATFSRTFVQYFSRPRP